MTEQTRMEVLKQKAELLGIKFHPNISEDTLAERIRQHMENDSKPETSDSPTPPASDDVGEPIRANPYDESVNAPAPRVMGNSKAAREHAERQKQWKEQLRLVRVRVTCLNPLKAALKGEIVTVGNKYVGTVRKFVPFGEATDNGYHIPYILYQELKSRKFNSVRTEKGANGQVVVHQRLVPEFAIEELPALSEEQLRELARQQAAAAGQ